MVMSGFEPWPPVWQVSVLSIALCPSGNQDQLSSLRSMHAVVTPVHPRDEEERDDPRDAHHVKVSTRASRDPLHQRHHRGRRHLSLRLPPEASRLLQQVRSLE